MAILVNKLSKFVIKDKNIKASSFRPFSHIATKPEDVTEWVPVNLENLGGTVAMDRRTAELLNDHDVSFKIGSVCNDKRFTFIESIEYKYSSGGTCEIEDVKDDGED